LSHLLSYTIQCHELRWVIKRKTYTTLFSAIVYLSVLFSIFWQLLNSPAEPIEMPKRVHMAPTQNDGTGSAAWKKARSFRQQVLNARLPFVIRPRERRWEGPQSFPVNPHRTPDENKISQWNRDEAKHLYIN